MDDRQGFRIGGPLEPAWDELRETLCRVYEGLETPEGAADRLLSLGWQAVVLSEELFSLGVGLRVLPPAPPTKRRHRRNRKRRTPRR